MSDTLPTQQSPWTPLIQYSQPPIPADAYGPTSAGLSSNDGKITNPSIQDASTPEDLRSKAWQLLAGAQDQVKQAEAAPTPPYQPPYLSPLAAAAAGLAGGYLNRLSPYSSEGTRALDAMLGTMDAQSQQQYRDEMQRHSQNIDAARLGYQMSQEQSKRMLDQAGDQDQIAAAAQRLKSQQDLQREEDARDAQLRQKVQAAQSATSAQDQLDTLADLHRHVARHLTATEPGRWLLGYQMADSLGKQGREKDHYANIFTRMKQTDAMDAVTAILEREELAKRSRLGPLLEKDANAAFGPTKG